MVWFVLAVALLVLNGLIWGVLSNWGDSPAIQCLLSLVVSGAVCFVVLSMFGGNASKTPDLPPGSLTGTVPMNQPLTTSLP